MTLSIVAVIVGLAVLVWSADRFVEGAAAVAKHLGMAPLVIGMVIIGFGTSAPEMVVSALASMQGNPALALGNALWLEHNQHSTGFRYYRYARSYCG